MIVNGSQVQLDEKLARAGSSPGRDENFSFMKFENV